MLHYVIEGGKKLEGEVHISGSKNAALPIIAATVLNGGISKLYNVPKIHDTEMMYKILENLGCTVKKAKNKVIIDSSKVHKYEIPENLMREMRSSVILAGAIIGRHHQAIFSYPGGCDIGTRPIDLHLKSFEKLGIIISKNYGNISCKCDTIENAKIDLDFPSVGATENIMLASCLGIGTTVISNAAREPEIEDLQNFLNRMGAKISGAGTNTVIIKGVQQLKDVSYNIMPDRIEAGTYLCAGAITCGRIKVLDLEPDHITPILNKLEEAGCSLNIGKDFVELAAPRRLKAVNIKTMPYPGFPTDMQSIFVAMLTTAKGTSLVEENVFESRYKFVQELERMRAKITISGKTAIIDGTKRIHGTKVKATDLRGGMAMIIEALVAKKETRIENIHYILRGYENLEQKLTNLGAKIYLKEGE